MFIHEYGSKEDPLVLFLAPMMVSGEDLYRLMHPYFTDNYHFIAPDSSTAAIWQLIRRNMRKRWKPSSGGGGMFWDRVAGVYDVFVNVINRRTHPLRSSGHEEETR